MNLMLKYLSLNYIKISTLDPHVLTNPFVVFEPIWDSTIFFINTFIARNINKLLMHSIDTSANYSDYTSKSVRVGSISGKQSFFESALLFFIVLEPV